LLARIGHKLRSRRGAALIIVLSVLLALSLLALASVGTTHTELSITGSSTRRTQSLLAAEAGMARADFVLVSSPGITAAAPLLSAINSDTMLPNASFQVAMDSTLPRRKVISLGRAGDGLAGVQALYEYGINRRNPWNNAVFIGAGDNGRPILGELVVHGPVHLVGAGETFEDDNSNGVWDSGEAFADFNHDGSYDPPVSPDSVAWSLSGTSAVLSHMAGMPGKIAPQMPAPEYVTFGSEALRTLHSELRVAHGQVQLEAGPQAGEANSTGGSPAYKETLDGVYVEDGFTGGSPSGSVHSDNGWANGYDLGSAPEVPSLDAPYTDSYGVEHDSYMEYLRSRSLVLTGDLELRSGVSMPLQSSGFGSISMNSSGQILGSGIIYVEGDIRLLDFGDLEYDGTFTLVSEGDVVIDEDLIPKDAFVTNDVIGILSHGEIRLGGTSDQPEVAAALYAQERIHVLNASTFIAGATVSNQFRADQPTHVYFVPGLAENLPPGLPTPGGLPGRVWRQVPRSWVELE